MHVARVQPVEAADVGAVRAALVAALEGTGPAVLPLPAAPAAVRTALVRAARVGDPLEHPAAALVPTSGSTGPPRLALLTREALLASAGATHARLGGSGGWALALPLTHVAGLQVLVRSWLAGAEPVVCGPLDEVGAAPAAGAAYLSVVPTQLHRALEARLDLSGYRAVLLGGGAAPAGLVERARASGVRVVTTYGMTETSGGCVYDGRALDGVRVRVGDDGRVRIGGPVLFSGYRGMPDATASALPHGELVTSDLGELDADGRLRVLGRVDDVVTTGGEKVLLPAVEAALREMPGVREAAVVAVLDDEWGSRLVAVVVAREATPPSLEDVRAAVGERLGRASAPRDLLTVPELPLLPNGKPDRLALRARVAAIRAGS